MTEDIPKLRTLIDALREKGVTRYEDDEVFLELGPLPVPRIFDAPIAYAPEEAPKLRDDGLTEAEASLLYDSSSRR